MKERISYQLGTLVRFRERDWVVEEVLEEGGDTLLGLRPLASSGRRKTYVSPFFLEAIPSHLATETLEEGRFPPPGPSPINKNREEALLFLSSALALLRENVTPLRSLAHVRFKPKPYQLVPLLMALRQETVRLLIADDVGVGKTVEAGLIVRELLSRGLARRVAVLVPPYLVDQWVVELGEKLGLDPVPITSSTLARVERGLPPGHTVYSYYPIQVLSIDFVKGERHKALFLQHPPDLVVVDEAHGAVGAFKEGEQRRYELLRALAEDPRRHLLLLTATPHSGIPEAFSRLLGLLDREFQTWDLEHPTEEQRDRLARHIVQRTRGDIEKDWKGSLPFPRRTRADLSYELSDLYRQVYEEARKVAMELYERGARAQNEWARQRYWWGALTFLRTVMSSPQAARVALERRVSSPEDLSDSHLEGVTELTDAVPSDAVLPLLSQKDPPSRLREFLEKLLANPEEDRKLQGLKGVLGRLLNGGYNPVVFCHFVETAQYVGKALQEAFPKATVRVVTGQLFEDQRREVIEELQRTPGPKVLVATDCLAEGINLQKEFSALVHYDLPWNPNRLEQREGRIDRYGQPKPEVRVVRYYGKDNPMDDVVLHKLVSKAETIRNALGIYIPLPQEEKYLLEELTDRVFRKHPSGVQPLLFPPEEKGPSLEEAWDEEARRWSRSRFAQRSIHPEEVLGLLGEVERRLGLKGVEALVVGGLSQRGVALEGKGEGLWRVMGLGSLPQDLEGLLQKLGGKGALLSFREDPVEGATTLGFAHPLVERLALRTLEEALKGKKPRVFLFRRRAPQTGFTYLYLLRGRYRMGFGGRTVLGEEVFAVSYREGASPAEALGEVVLASLLDQRLGDLLPSPLSLGEGEDLARMALEAYEALGDELKRLHQARAQRVQEAHRAVRRAVGERVREVKVEPAPPLDLLGVVVFEEVQG